MNSGGAIEEAGTTARQTIEVLKSTPVLLAILVFNLIWLVLVGWVSFETGARWERILNAAFEACPTLRQHSGIELQSESSRPVTLAPLTKQGQPDSELNLLSLQKPGASEMPLPEPPTLTKP